MAKPFDASTKFLVELNPADWLRLLGLPLGPTRIAEADLSTVSAAADRLVVVDAQPKPYGLIVEFQGNTDAEFEGRLLEYSVLAGRRLGIPVAAVAMLMRPFAGHKALRGRYVVRGPDNEMLLDFRYRALRIWQMPPEAFLSGGLAILPLATITRTRRSDLPRLLDRIEERLEAETTPADADLLRTATFVLLGLKFDKLLAEKLMSRNVLELSSTYRALKEDALAEGLAQGLAEGRAQEARRLIVRLGTPRLGEPTSGTISILDNIPETEALECIADRLLTVETWTDLLA